jgi:hypothetical protein
MPERVSVPDSRALGATRGEPLQDLGPHGGVANDSATGNDVKKLRPLVARVKSEALP